MSEDKGFEVRDKRKVTMDGEIPAGLEEKTPEEKPVADVREEPGAGAGGGGLPALDFISFAGSLGATALMYMGEVVSPDQPKGMTDLAAAKQMIDLITMLKEKTKGNLSEEESGMLDNLIYNLQIRFVRQAEQK